MENPIITKAKTLANTDISLDWPHHKVALSIIWGLVLLAVSLVINYLAGTYATEQAGSAVRDIILDHIPTMDVDGIFIYGIIAFFVFIAGLLIHRPKRAPFVLKSLSLFIIIRSFFLVLTHIGPAAQTAAFPTNGLMAIFTFTGDLFFSAHTGLPFLMALVFWQNRWLRIVFLCISILFGVVVLLGHIHYSIDVFSAFFITFGIYKIAEKLFKKEFDLINTLK